jgi:hypothetical protein
MLQREGDGIEYLAAYSVHAADVLPLQSPHQSLGKRARASNPITSHRTDKGETVQVEKKQRRDTTIDDDKTDKQQKRAKCMKAKPMRSQNSPKGEIYKA